MALRRTEPEWKEFMQSAGITEDARSTTYAQAFLANNLTELSIPQLDKETLTELGVTSIGDRLSILNLANSRGATAPPTQNAAHVTKASVQAKLSTVCMDMTHPQFRKFEKDWAVYKGITQLQVEQFTNHLYNACDDTVQNSLINTHSRFLQYDETEALNALRSTVTQRVNPELHRKEFGDILQRASDSIKEFEVRLRSAAIECAYTCPGCQYDLSDINIRGQFIRGIHDKTLQTDVLAKTDQLKTLEQLVKHAESFEAAVRDGERLRLDTTSGPNHAETNVYAVGNPPPPQHNAQNQNRQQQRQRRRIPRQQQPQQ